MLTSAAESFQDAHRFSCCFVSKRAFHYLFIPLLPPSAAPVFLLAVSSFSFVLFDLAEILFSSRRWDSERGSWAVVTSVAVDPTSLSDSVPLPFVRIRVSHFLFQAVEGSHRPPLTVPVCVCETGCCLLSPDWDTPTPPLTVRTCWESLKEAGCCCFLVTHSG